MRWMVVTSDNMPLPRRSVTSSLSNGMSFGVARAASIVDVGGVPEVAAALGVAATTIKTHLGRLFAKTGVARQADLVKLVAGFSTPLAG